MPRFLPRASNFLMRNSPRLEIRSRWKSAFRLGIIALACATILGLGAGVYLNYKNYFASDCPIQDRASRAYLLDALDLMQKHSVRADKVDWARTRQRACESAKQATTPAETYAAINGAIASLVDFHSSLRPPRPDTEVLSSWDYLEYRLRLRFARVLEVFQKAADPSAAPMTEVQALPVDQRYTVEGHGFSMLDKRVGYLSLGGIVSGAPAKMMNYADTLAQAVDQIVPRSRCGVVVDLRRNGGGNMYPQFLGLHRLYGDEKVMGMKYLDGREIWVAMPGRSYCHVTDSHSNCFLRLPQGNSSETDYSKVPVAVLLSRRTSSAAEALTIGFLGRENTRTFGDKTSGSTTGTLPILLRDGAVLVLAVSYMTDRSGKSYPDRIIPDEATARDFPDLPARTFADLYGDATALAAVAWLTAQPGCVSK